MFPSSRCDNWCTCGVGRVLGANVSVHWTFWFNWIFQVVFSLLSIQQNGVGYVAVIAVAWGPLCLLVLLMHEVGHMLCNRKFGGTCTHTMLWPLGGFNDCQIANGTCWQEFWVALCGPLAHLPLLILFWILYVVFDDDDGGKAKAWFAELFNQSRTINLMIMVLNFLLPIYPMDAANMVAALSVQFFEISVDTAAMVLTAVGAAVGVICLAFGIYYIATGGSLGLFLLFMGLYALYSAYQMYGVAKNGTAENHPVFAADCYYNNSSSRPNNQSRQYPHDPDDDDDMEMGDAYAKSPSQSPKRKVGASKSPGGGKKTVKKGTTTPPASPRKNDSSKSPGKSPSTPKKHLPRRGG